MKATDKEFNQKHLQRLKELSGFTDAELARRADISRQVLWKLLHKPVKNPSHRVIKGLTEALGCTEADLIA